MLIALGKVYREWRHYPIATKMFVSAIERLQKEPGRATQRLVSALGNLAQLYYENDQHDLADQTYRQAPAALDATERGGDRPWLLHNQAMLHYHLGRHDEARRLYEEAKQLWVEAHGVDHPFVATVAANLALLYWAIGEPGPALEAFAETNTLRDREMRRVLAVGSERKRAAYARELQSDLHKAVELLFHVGPSRPDVARFAAHLLLQRKGRVLDAIAQTFAQVREQLGADDRRVFDHLQTVRTEVASLVAPRLVSSRPFTDHDRLAALRQEEARLEAALSYRTAVYQPGLDAVTLEAVQQAVPPDAAVIDLLKFSIFDPVRTGREGPWREARYAALVLRTTGEPRWFDLGSAAAIDAQADRLRRRSCGRGRRRCRVRRRGRRPVHASHRAAPGRAERCAPAPHRARR